MMPDCLYWLRLDARSTIPLGSLSPERREELQVEANQEDLRSPACDRCPRCLEEHGFAEAVHGLYRGDDLGGN